MTALNIKIDAELAQRLAEVLESRPALRLSGIAQGLAQPQPVAAIHRLGSELIEVDCALLAAEVLVLAHRAEPLDAEILADLVAAFELSGQRRRAIEAMDKARGLVETHPLLSYLRAFNAFFVGDTKTPRRLLPGLQAHRGSRLRFMTQRIAQMLGRADAVAEHPALEISDRRVGHFVLTGGLWLGESLEEGPSARIIHDRLQRLATVLDAWGLSVPLVFYPPERSCEILAQVLGHLLGCATKEWLGHQEHGLITIFNPAALIPEISRAFRSINEGQPLFIQAVDPGSEHPVAPDLLGDCSAVLVPPWGPGFLSGNRYIEPAVGTPAEVARDLLDSGGGAEADDLGTLRELAEALLELPPGLQPTALRKSGPRDPLWVLNAA